MIKSHQAKIIHLANEVGHSLFDFDRTHFFSDRIPLCEFKAKIIHQANKVGHSIFDFGRTHFLDGRTLLY